MNTISTILLSFIIAAHLISKFSPVPFIGMAIAILGFPLALKIPLKEIFMIEILGTAFSIAINPDVLAFTYNSFLTYIGFLPLNTQIIVTLIFSVGLVICLTFFSFLSALLTKFLSRYTPKQFKVLLNK